MILNIRLQKSDLKKIFYYVYKYKIAIYKSNLLFDQNGNLKIAVVISLYFILTLLLSTGGLGYT